MPHATKDGRCPAGRSALVQGATVQVGGGRFDNRAAAETPRTTDGVLRRANYRTDTLDVKPGTTYTLTITKGAQTLHGTVAVPDTFQGWAAAVLLVAGGPPDSAPSTPTPQLRGGRPIVRHITPQAYAGNGLVWDVAQDDRGLLYLATSYGLQQYDGARWRSLPTGNRTTPFAVARDSSGTLYVGAQDALGMYRPDAHGRLRYRSLRPGIPAPYRPVGDVSQVVAAGGAVFFRAATGVFRWSDGRAQVVADTTTRGLFACGGRAYVQDHAGRLYAIHDTTRTRRPLSALRARLSSAATNATQPTDD
ncbi:hypothetical protein [Salisaeta longa]|uniref:hypothetical protein n=1 Tax=Salisaeta longa TaxID=503170 RepID=UPI0003B3380B|nr:hypothetical protein [Salisaeta longa]